MTTEKDIQQISTEMNTEKAPDWLPSGWAMEVCKRKNGRKDVYYVDTTNELKFESERAALHYLETGEVPNEDAVSKVVWIVQHPCPSTDVVCMDKDTQVCIDKDTQVDTSKDWLPLDWEIDYGVGENGIRVKHYIEPTSGLRFSSKKDVLCYLGYEAAATSLDDSWAPDSSEEESRGRTSSGCEVEDYTRKSDEVEVIKVDDTLDWLPKDWEVEYGQVKNGKREEYYIEPTSGFKFSSKEDVLCYLEYEEASSSSSEDIPSNMICLVPDLSPSNMICTVPDLSVEECRGGTSSGWEVQDNTTKSGSTAEKRKGVPLKKRARCRGNSALIIQGPNVPTDDVVAQDTERRKGTPLKRKARSRGIYQDQNVRRADDMMQVDDSLEWLPIGWKIQYDKGAAGLREQYYIEPTQGHRFSRKEDVLVYLGQVASTSKEHLTISNMICMEDSSKRKGTPLKKRARSRNDALRFEDQTVKSTNDVACLAGNIEANKSLDRISLGWEGDYIERISGLRDEVDQSLGCTTSSWGVGVGIGKRGRKKRGITEGTTDAVHINGQDTPLMVENSKRERGKGLPTRTSRRLRGLEPEVQPETSKANYLALVPVDAMDVQSTNIGEQLDELVEAHDNQAALEEQIVAELLQDPCVSFAFRTLTGKDPVAGEITNAVEEHQHQHINPVLPEKRHLPDLNELANESFLD